MYDCVYVCTRVYGEVKSGSQPPRKSANLLCWGVCQELRFSKPQSAPKAHLATPANSHSSSGVCARNCALANPKVPQNPSCHTSKPPQQQRGVSKIIPASGRKGSPGLAWIIPAWGGAPPWGRNPFLPQGGRDSAPRQESRNPPKRLVLATQ